MAEKDTVPTPPNRPTIIRAQNLTDGPGPPVPTRPAPPGRPSQPRSASDPKQPSADSHVHQAAAASKLTPSVPQRPGAPPRQHQNVSSPSNLSSSSVQPSSNTSVKKKRPEITIVSARPMNEVGFRDIKNEPLSKSDEPKQSALNSSDQNTSLPTKSATEDGKLNKPVVAARNLPSPKIADKTPSRDSPPQIPTRTSGPTGTSAIDTLTDSTLNAKLEEPSTSMPVKDKPMRPTIIRPAKPNLVSSSPSKDSSNDGPQLRSSQPPCPKPRQRHVNEFSDQSSGTTDMTFFGETEETPTKSSVHVLPAGPPAVKLKPTVLPKPNSSENALPGEQDNSLESKSLNSDIRGPPPPLCTKPKPTVLPKPKPSDKPQNENSDTSKTFEDIGTEVKFCEINSLPDSSLDPKYSLSVNSFKRPTIIKPLRQQGAQEQTRGLNTTNDLSSKTVSKEDNDSDSFGEYVHLRLRQDSGQPVPSPRPVTIAVSPAEQKKANQSCFSESGTSRDDSEVLRPPSKPHPISRTRRATIAVSHNLPPSPPSQPQEAGRISVTTKDVNSSGNYGNAPLKPPRLGEKLPPDQSHSPDVSHDQRSESKPSDGKVALSQARHQPNRPEPIGRPPPPTLRSDPQGNAAKGKCDAEIKEPIQRPPPPRIPLPPTPKGEKSSESHDGIKEDSDDLPGYAVVDKPAPKRPQPPIGHSEDAKEEMPGNVDKIPEYAVIQKKYPHRPHSSHGSFESNRFSEGRIKDDDVHKSKDLSETISKPLPTVSRPPLPEVMIKDDDVHKSKNLSETVSKPLPTVSRPPLPEVMIKDDDVHKSKNLSETVSKPLPTVSRPPLPEGRIKDDDVHKSKDLSETVSKPLPTVSRPPLPEGRIKDDDVHKSKDLSETVSKPLPTVSRPPLPEGRIKDDDVHKSKNLSETVSKPLPTVSRPPLPKIKPASSSHSDKDDLTHGTKPTNPESRPPPPNKFQQPEESPAIEKKPTRPKDAPQRPVVSARKLEPTLKQEPQKLSPSKSALRDTERPLPTRPGPGHPLYHYMATQPHGVASFEYAASQPDELSFQVGDVILLTKQIDSNWMMGKNGNQEGLFPSSFIEIKVPLGWQHKVPGESDSDSEEEYFDATAEKPDLIGHGPRCRARFDYEGGEDEDLEFEEGDVIKLLEKIDEEWFKGEVHGKVGMFPASFVEIIKDLPGEDEVVDVLYEAEGATSHPGHMTTALYTYTGEVGDLSFKEGDKIKVLGFVQKGWLVGEARGKRGKFPANFIDAEFEIPAYDEKDDNRNQDKKKSSVKKIPSEKKTSVKRSPVQSPRKTHDVEDEIEGMAGEGEVIDIVYEAEGATSHPGHMTTAVFGYSGGVGELTFKEGDRIKVLGFVKKGWLVGEARGKRGKFPANFIDAEFEIPPYEEEAELNLHTADHGRKKTSVKKNTVQQSPQKTAALYDFEGETDQDLTFKEGDIIEILENVDDKWLRGRVHGREGIFPANFVDLSQSHGAVKADTESKKDVIGEALFDFVGEAVNELTFKVGDKIVLLEKVEDSSGWQWGVLNGKKGMFPSEFVKSA